MEVFLVVAVSVAGVVLRPFGWREAVWAVGGAAVLVVTGAVPVAVAWRRVEAGGDVYLFLAGMMVLSELAQREGVFAWLAGWVARAAGGSAVRMFGLVYLMGVGVTVFLSNDAAAVVMTPAVVAVTRAANANQPLPFVLVCALVANAASFVLPISNPANLVVYGAAMPNLASWLGLFALPSAAAILATFLLLSATQHRALRQPVNEPDTVQKLAPGGLVAGAGIGVTAVILLVVSGFGGRLGLATFLAGCVTAACVLAATGKSPVEVLRHVSWDVLVLVAGLFVLVVGLDQRGMTAVLAGLVREAAAASPGGALWGVGLATGFLCNLVNNLPAGLIAGHALQAAGAVARLRAAAVVGIDLGPNLSVTGSLATILWLTALRRENLDVSAWTFLKTGVVVMPAALLCAILCIP